MRVDIRSCDASAIGEFTSENATAWFRLLDRLTSTLGRKWGGVSRPEPTQLPPISPRPRRQTSSFRMAIVEGGRRREIMRDTTVARG